VTDVAARAVPDARAVSGPRTLRRRLLVTVVGLIAVVAAVMGLVSTLALRSSLLAQVDERVTAANERATNAMGRMPEAGSGAGTGSSGSSGEPSSDDSSGTVTPPEPWGDGRPDSFNGPGQDVGTVNLQASDDLVRSGYIDADGEFQQLDDAQTAELLTMPADGEVHSVTLAGLGSYRAVAATSAEGGVIVTAMPTDQAQATVQGFLVTELVVAALGLLLAAAGANVLVRRDLRPLTRVAATATRVSELPLDRGAVQIRERVPEADTDPSTEVGQVGAALNRMLGHVEGALAARYESESQVRRFVADASHELRTPLASIRGYTELIRRSDEPLPAGTGQALARVESETVRMTALVEDMLLLARLDAGRPLEREPVDLAMLAVDAVADAHAAGPDHVWRLEVAGAESDDEGAGGGVAGAPGDEVAADDETDDDSPTVVAGDDHRLRQVLANLLTNARLHTPAGTTVVVQVGREGGDVVVRVADDGPGIDPDLLPRLFKRFTRGDAARGHTGGSTGLGLAIAHAVVTAHGGALTCDSRPGRTTFTVRLPSTP
jgi:two-component system OmpR family sensor kinase